MKNFSICKLCSPVEGVRSVLGKMLRKRMMGVDFTFGVTYRGKEFLDGIPVYFFLQYVKLLSYLVGLFFCCASSRLFQKKFQAR